MTKTLGQAALALARKGFAVFPCVSGAKKPLLKGGYKLATRDEFQIVAWWDEYPEANIGCHPDACAPRYLVVDVDVRETEDGRATILEEQSKASLHSATMYPPTVSTYTPSGGQHLWYTLSEDCPKVQSSTRKLGAGLDVRSYGGYVIMPPSRIKNKKAAYVWGDTITDLAAAPIGLISASGHAQDHHPDADVWQCEPDLSENVERAVDWLLKEAEAGHVAVAGQGGNNFTFATAAILRDMGLSEEKAVDLMCDDWNLACKPPWEGGELAQIVTNAYEYATRPAGNRTAKPESVEKMQAMQVVQVVRADPISGESRLSNPIGSSVPLMPADAVSSDDDKPPRFPVIWGNDINKVKEPKWLVEQAIQKATVVEFYGTWSAGKTLVALDLALSVSLGLEWAGHLCQQAPTVLVTNEGVYSISKRRRAWMELHEVDEAPDFGLVADMPLFSDPDQVRALGASLAQAPLGILIIDTMAQAMAGMDENSQKDASLFLRYCYELRDLLQCSVVILHHTGKDQARGSRGSTAIPGGMDTVFEVTQPERGTVLVTMKKQKDGAPWILPARFTILQAADSVALRPTTGSQAKAIDEHETQHIAWEIAVRELLIAGKELGEAMPVGNKALSENLARHVTDGDSSGEGTNLVSEALIKQIYNWLRREATCSRPGLKPWVSTWAKSGVAATWQPPANCPENLVDNT